MSFEEFKGIIDQFPSLRWIGLTGIDESFLNKDFMKMLRYVKSKNVYVELYDNFFLVDEKTADELIDMGIDRILISLDAATKETYEKLRVGSNFERVINNVENLFKLKKEKGNHYPEIDFHYIINKYNLQEVPQYVELVHSLADGEDAHIQFSRLLHEFKEIKNLFTEVSEETIDAASEKAKELGVGLLWNEDVPQTKPPISNCIEWTMPFIFATGDVIPCCAANEAGHRDFQKETALGNVFSQSFKDIWNGEKYKTLRKKLSKGEVPVQCIDCCAYNLKGCSVRLNEKPD
jgi:MoaA/NifB/PqqE/SkfB family radical SAM enzyme